MFFAIGAHPGFIMPREDRHEFRLYDKTGKPVQSIVNRIFAGGGCVSDRTEIIKTPDGVLPITNHPAENSRQNTISSLEIGSKSIIPASYCNNRTNALYYLLLHTICFARRSTMAAKITKKASAKETFTLQWSGNDVSFDQIRSRILEKSGKTSKDIKNLEIYVKPEEGMAYYVINGTETGDVGLF